MKRRLATILVADAVASTAAMEADEEAAVALIERHFQAFSKTMSNYGGRVFSNAGDSLLVEFDSPINALRATLEARAQLAAEGQDNAMRFGLNLADVVVVGDDLRGDGVNIAARLQSAAAPGEVLASETVFNNVRRNSPCTFHEPETLELKGISEPLVVYRVKAIMNRHLYQIDSTRPEAKVSRRPNSVAVAPFSVASSADEDQSFLAEGFTEDLILELSRVRDLFVVSRTAADVLRGRDPVEIGTKAGVGYVLSGSVRKLGSKVRLNISLTSTKDGAVIWSDRIQRPFDEILDVMDDITSRVAATVFGRIEQAELDAAKIKRPGSMSAYEQYLRGLELHRLGGVTLDLFRDAMQWFDQAIQTDATFSRAYSMRVCSASNLADFDVEEGQRQIEKALTLDPNDPEAHRIMGMMQLRIHRNFDAARRHFERSMQLAPSNAYIIGRAAAFYIFDGDPIEGLRLLDRAEAMDPFLPVWVTEERIAALYCLGRYDEMMATAKALPFQTRRSRIYRVAVHMKQGEKEEAERLVATLLVDDPQINSDFIVFEDMYRDESIIDELVTSAQTAGLPGGVAVFA
ncbi:adenylate/guanylate cyclase domain-containing protein [Marimonas sp. MJW-29]|uniref:Adenylate/guanylate cyclase domain-containing protein n=1 Tax=Sulfitobacter sediminis TaxID=3234186 RepID=A0ABV3RKL0_9RHOB